MKKRNTELGTTNIHVSLDLTVIFLNIHHPYKLKYEIGVSKMSCNCCSLRLNSGMIHKKDPNTGQKFKSCPHCSAANGNEHVFHPYPGLFGITPARVTAKNPDGDQSYCINCRTLEKGVPSHTYMNGKLCSSLM